MQQVKSIIKSAIHKAISPAPINRFFTKMVWNTEDILIRIANLGFNPELIFDVGAYQGDFTKFCIKVWPKTNLACFEVLPHKVIELRNLAADNPAIQVFPMLLGSRSQDQVAFYQLDNKAETSSSVLNAHISFNVSPKYYPMSTVDEIVNNQLNGRVPDLLKMDVQGYELEVLKGAEKSLDKIQVILAEVNFLDIYKGSPLLAEMITWLDARNFVAYDISGFWRRPLDQALFQADFIFVQREHFIRADKRYNKS